jgi:hypothetical protein
MTLVPAEVCRALQFLRPAVEAGATPRTHPGRAPTPRAANTPHSVPPPAGSEAAGTLVPDTVAPARFAGTGCPLGGQLQVAGNRRHADPPVGEQKALQQPDLALRRVLMHVAERILPFPVVDLLHLILERSQQGVTPGTVGTDPARRRAAPAHPISGDQRSGDKNVSVAGGAISFTSSQKLDFLTKQSL